MLEQIKRLKEDKQENRDLKIKSTSQKMRKHYCLKNHNQTLHAQIKKLKDEKKNKTKKKEDQLVIEGSLVNKVK